MDKILKILDRDKKKSKKICVTSIGLGCVVFVICLFVLYIIRDNICQKEVVNKIYQYRTFESQVEKLINSNLYLLEGYAAYLKSYPDFDENTSLDYLESLLVIEEQKYIRSVAIIKDTTIIYQYPLEGNESAIGIDLAKTANQEKQVKYVKQSGRKMLQGPFELVQGGTAFSIRIPIVLKDSSYWGQLGVVLKFDEIISKINQYAENSRLEITVRNEESGTPFFTNTDLVNSDAMTFIIDPSFINWTVDICMNDKALMFKNPYFLLTLLLSPLLALMVGVISYRYLKASYEISIISNRDFLTGLYNRRFLDSYSDLMFASAKRMGWKAGVFLIDLDDFKIINDNLGHNVGDKILTKIGLLFKENTRAGEACFRIGGDEFLLLVPHFTAPEKAGLLAQRIRKFLIEGINSLNYDYPFDLSVGYAVYPDDGETFEELYEKADRRLYERKELK